MRHAASQLQARNLAVEKRQTDQLFRFRNIMFSSATDRILEVVEGSRRIRPLQRGERSIMDWRGDDSLMELRMNE